MGIFGGKVLEKPVGAHHHCKCGEVFEAYTQCTEDRELEHVLLAYLINSVSDRLRMEFYPALCRTLAREITSKCPRCHHDALRAELEAALTELKTRRDAEVAKPPKRKRGR